MFIAVMRCLFYIASLALIHNVQAQSSSPTSSSTATLPTQTVKVGWDSHAFEPQTIFANPGDVVVFEFIASGHSVVQSYLEQPCVPYDTNHPGHSTFFSGFKNYNERPTPLPTWNLTINDTSPIFYYCSKKDSCLLNNMIGVINPNATWTLEAQLASIKNAPYMLQPGQEIPAEKTSSSNTKHGITLSSGAIAGIVVASILVLGLACALFWFVGRHRTLKNTLHSQSNGAVERWVQSTQPPSSIGGGVRPPSYGGDPAHMVALDMPKHWEGQPLYTQYPSPPPMTPPIVELSACEPVELEESRGRSRMRDNRLQGFDTQMTSSLSPATASQVHEKG